jgi:hypothetical protein
MDSIMGGPASRIGPDLTALSELTDVNAMLVFELVEWRSPYLPGRSPLDESYLFPHFADAAELLRGLEAKGADLLYIACALLWFVDESKRYVFRDATEQELKDAADDDPTVRILDRLLKEDLPRLVRTFGEDRIAPLTEMIKKLRADPCLTILHMDMAEAKPQILKKVGRPPEYFFNLMMLVISRHLAKTTKLTRGYDSIGRLMVASFPEVFAKSFSKEHVRNRLLNIERNQSALIECQSFENRFLNIRRNYRDKLQELRTQKAQKEWEIFARIPKPATEGGENS